MVQTFCIVITNGTNDPVKVHAAVVNGFAQRKIGNKVNFVLMAEGGNIADDKALRAIAAFGLPPMATLLDDPVMKDADMVSWTVWCALASLPRSVRRCC